MAFEDWFIARARVSSKPHKNVTADDKMTFFHQLSTLITSGTPLLRALQICAEQSQSIRFRRALDEIADRVASGSSLHAAAAAVAYPSIFQHHWIEVLHTGEVTGKMSFVLLELNKQIRDSRETARKIKGALMYPIILILIAVAALTVMLWFVVPTFAAMFKDMGAALPGITQLVVDASNFVVRFGLYMLGGAAAAAFAAHRYMQTDVGRRRVIGVGLALPLVGPLLVQSAMYRFASNIGLLLKSGVPMLEALVTLESVFHTNPIYRSAFGKIRGRVAAGRPLAVSLEESGLFTSMITNMVQLGEESGQLAEVMEQIAPYYKEKLESLIAKLTKLLEPVIIMGMGITMAGVMLAIYLPMFDMAGKIH